MKDFFSLPNILSTIRIALVPVFAVLYLNGLPIWALVVFIIASLTDVLDGFLARRFHMVTQLGKVLDPFADKLLKITVLACLVTTHVIPLWFLLIMLVLDLTLIIAASILFKQEIVVKSNFVGKAGTTIISIGIILSFFQNYFFSTYLIVLYCGLAVVFASAVTYGLVYVKMNKRTKKEG